MSIDQGTAPSGRVSNPYLEGNFAPVETVPLAEARGRTCAELVAPYPPGIPVLAPGERITEEALDALDQARQAGVRIAYAADASLATVRVTAATVLP